MLIWRWKWNKVWRRIFNVVKRWYSASVWRQNNVAQRWYKGFSTLHEAVSTLFQRLYDMISTLFQRGLNFRQSNIETNRANDKYKFLNRLIRFILLHEKTFFFNILTIQQLINYLSNFLTMVYILIQW